MSYTFSGILTGPAPVHPWLRVEPVRALRDRAMGRYRPSGDPDSVWYRGLCQLLAAAMALRWNAPMVFTMKRDAYNNLRWNHVAVLLPDGRTVDARQRYMSPEELTKAWGAESYEVLTVPQTRRRWPDYLNNYGGESRVLKRLVTFVPKTPPSVGDMDDWV